MSATATAPNGVATPTNAVDPWTMEVPAPGGNGEYVLCPSGTFPATIVGVFDVGTHTEKTQKGEDKQMRKLVLALELAKKRDDGKPYLLCERFTWSMSEKANFYALVCAVMGRKFKEGEKFDPRALSGLPVMVMVAHNTTGTAKGEKTYHNVETISQFPDGFPLPTPTRTPVIWSVVVGGPLPPGIDDWPHIYGKSIKTLASESAEQKARGAAMTQTNAAGEEVPF